MENWTDETVMPFGKHKGLKLANVPAGWFLWYNEFATNQRPELMQYIKENMMCFLQETDLKNIKHGKY